MLLTSSCLVQRSHQPQPTSSLPNVPPSACALLRSKALEHDPYHVKALYRRAQGQYGEGTSTGLEAAVRDLTEAQKLEPGNNQVGCMQGWWEGPVILWQEPANRPPGCRAARQDV